LIDDDDDDNYDTRLAATALQTADITIAVIF
jgi:hypothetical protein